MERIILGRVDNRRDSSKDHKGQARSLEEPDIDKVCDTKTYRIVTLAPLI